MNMHGMNIKIIRKNFGQKQLVKKRNGFYLISGFLFSVNKIRLFVVVVPCISINIKVFLTSKCTLY
jgi:hypothetical protein